jgi:predicted transcriptional regulator
MTDLVKDQAAKAVSHHVRRGALGLLRNSELSPKDLAVALGEPLGNTAYHMRSLLELGVIRTKRTAARRGALQHYYVLDVKAPQTIAALALLDVLDNHG